MDKCLACGRVFEKLADYPKVHIVSFDRVEIPEIISAYSGELRAEWSAEQIIPEAVFKLFKETGKDMLSYEGFVYQRIRRTTTELCYKRSKDITETVRSVISNPKIQKSLSALEEFVEQEVPTKKLLALPGFKELIKIKGYNLSLSFKEQASKDLRVCRIYIFVSSNIWSASIPEPFSQDLAKMSYEGRTHK